MFKSLVFLSILALATAATTAFSHRNYDSDAEPQKEFVDILKFVDEKRADGSFHFAYEGTDGSSRLEQGRIVNSGTEDEEFEVTGSYRYYDADGQLIEVKYTAGKGGFVPVGTNIPQEISAAASAAGQIARSQAAEEAAARREISRIA